MGTRREPIRSLRRSRRGRPGGATLRPPRRARLAVLVPIRVHHTYKGARRPQKRDALTGENPWSLGGVQVRTVCQDCPALHLPQHPDQQRPWRPGSTRSRPATRRRPTPRLRSRPWMSVPSRSDIRAPTPRVNQGRRCEPVEANAGDESSSAFINERSVQTIDLRSEEIGVNNANLRSRSGR